MGQALLTRARRKALHAFRHHALQALAELEKEAPNKAARALYRAMAENVRRTPLYFYPSRALASRASGAFLVETRGEHVNTVFIVQRGRQRFLVRSHYINLPAGHIFAGDKITAEGLVTLCHEYAHFPKKAALRFAAGTPLSPEQAEELFADILAAKLMARLGFPKKRVLAHFAGRTVVYGAFPYQAFLRKAIRA